VILLAVLWDLVQTYLVWVLLSKYSAHVLSFFVKGHRLIPFKNSSSTFMLDMSHPALVGQRPFLAFIDISYGVFLVPPCEWDMEVVFSCCDYLT